MRGLYGAALVLCAAASVASAQDTVPADPQQPPVVAPRRPPRGLFGGDEARSGAPGLTANVSLFGGHDDNVVAGQQGSGINRQSVDGNYGSVLGELMYTAVRRRATFFADGSSELRYFDTDRDFQQMSHRGSANVVLPVGRRNELSLRQGIRYSPYYQLDVSPSLPSFSDPEVPQDRPVDVNQSLEAIQSVRLDSDVSFNQPVGRGSMRYLYGFRTARFDDETMDSTAQDASARYSRRVSRYATMRLGYGYQTVTHPTTHRGDLSLHNIDVGLGYSRPLSFSRRTTVGFSTGTGIARTATTVRYRLIADADAHHEIGRTWLLRAAYRQGLQVVELYPEPLFGYTVRGSLIGLLGTRSDVSIDVASSSGSFDSARESGGYGAYHGSARFRRALTRTLAAYVEYSYYQYTVADGPTLTPFASQPFERHGIRVGLTLWLPLFVPRHIDAAR